MTADDIDRTVAQAADEMDQRFDAAQPELIATLRAEGVSDVEIPGVLAEAHSEYWRERCALLNRYRSLLEAQPSC